MASANTPRVRTARRYTPVLTFIFIGISVLGYLLQQVDSSIFNKLALVGYAQYSDGTWLGVAHGEWYRLLTVALLHGGILHLLFNMYALWVIGASLESVIGRGRFAAIYLLSLIGGSSSSLLFNASNIPAVGASGAIFGLFGATVIVNRRSGRNATSMYSVIAINLAMGFIIPNVDWHAHLGGLIFGAASAALLVAGPIRKWMGLRIVGICLLVLLALFLDSQRVTELQLLVGQ
ncbi:MAG: rhomboid family intramembrane serine protease [Actinobacteria bacterium]|nr:rhomboid family intramembrane serine protease [Actinomycetota bacterium]